MPKSRPVLFIWLCTLLCACDSGQQPLIKAEPYAASFHLDGKQATWSPNTALKLGNAANELPPNQPPQSDNGYTFEIIGRGTPAHYVIKRRRSSDSNELIISSPKTARTVLKARWSGSQNNRGIAYSADFDADDRYELYWLANTAESADDAVRLTPNLALGSDVADWWTLNQDQFLVHIKRGKHSSIQLIERQGVEALNREIISTPLPIEAGVLSESSFWIQTDLELKRFSLPAKTLDVKGLEAIPSHGWIQHFPAGFGVGLSFEEGFAAVIDQKLIQTSFPVLDGVSCGQQAWLVGAVDEGLSLHYFVDNKLVDALAIDTVPGNLRCERQRSK